MLASDAMAERLTPRPLVRPAVTDLQAIDSEIRRRHLLKHPFYQAWSRGELGLPTLRDYATQYYWFESSFPRYVAGAYSKLRDPKQRATLLENLVDEEGRPPTHPELWADFASSLGVRRSRLGRPPVEPAAARLCGTYETLTLGKSVAKALGALYAYESIFPEVAAEKSRGLRAFYGIESSRAHEFFRVHVSADVAHGRAERALLRDVIRSTPRAGPEAVEGTRRTLRAWWRFLDTFDHQGIADREHRAG